jgi:hypothetical protein
VSNCKGGVILGEDGESHTGIGPQNNNITNCNILGCQFPLLFGKIKSNTFTNINIDNMNKPTSFSAIHMLDGTSSYASCSNNVFNAINIKNVINTHSIVRLGDYSHDNFISVGHYGGNYRARHCLFEPNSVNNRVRIKVMQDFNANTNWLVEDHGTRNNYKIQDIHVK